MTARHEDYVTTVRAHAGALWEAYLALLGLQSEWSAQDYANTLELDANGQNGHLSAVEVGAAIFDTPNALKTLMDAGHATNLTELL